MPLSTTNPPAASATPHSREYTSWYTGIFPTRNGGGFRTEQFPDAYKAIWDFSGQKTTSRHVPHVEFTGIVHAGLRAPPRRETS